MFDICLILHADHELNASTFTTRVVAGTLAGMYGAVTAGVAALAGPLHGGANTNVMNMLLEIGDMDKVEAFVDNALAEKRKIMGIGHAVYKTEDPRATWLRVVPEGGAALDQGEALPGAAGQPARRMPTHLYTAPHPPRPVLHDQALRHARKLQNRRAPVVPEPDPA